MNRNVRLTLATAGKRSAKRKCHLLIVARLPGQDVYVAYHLAAPRLQTIPPRGIHTQRPAANDATRDAHARRCLPPGEGWHAGWRHVGTAALEHDAHADFGVADRIEEGFSLHQNS